MIKENVQKLLNELPEGVDIVAACKTRTSQEILLQKIITEGIISIASNMHPQILEKKLKSFLTPSARHGEMVSLVELKERLELKDLVK